MPLDGFATSPSRPPSSGSAGGAHRRLCGHRRRRRRHRSTSSRVGARPFSGRERERVRAVVVIRSRLLSNQSAPVNSLSTDIPYPFRLIRFPAPLVAHLFVACRSAPSSSRRHHSKRGRATGESGRVVRASHHRRRSLARRAVPDQTVARPELDRSAPSARAPAGARIGFVESRQDVVAAVAAVATACPWPTRRSDSRPR